MTKNKDNKSSVGFLSYMLGVIVMLAIFVMALVTVFSNKYQEVGQMQQCQNTVERGVYYSPVCFFGRNYEYAKAS